MSILQRNSNRSLSLQRQGFTLIEMLVVIGIIGVLLAIILPTIFATNKAANRKRTQADLGTVQMALEEYRKDFKDYPRQQVANRAEHILGCADGAPG